jgi:hypothetical protein
MPFDEALRRLVNTPPQPNKAPEPPKRPKRKAKKKAPAK